MNINKDTRVCISVSSNPGNTGTKIQNALYNRHNLNFIYKSFKIEDINRAILGVRGLGLRGCSVSMPFKRSVINHLDKISLPSRETASVNTVVNDNGFLNGYNTDIMGAERAILDSNISSETAVIFGAGCTGMSVAYSLFLLGFKKILISNRTEHKAISLSNKVKKMGIACHTISEVTGIKNALFINCSSIGMARDDTFPISDGELSKFSLVFDVVAASTDLTRRSKNLKIPTIPGIEMAINQSLFQFELYTGKKVDFKSEKHFIEGIL